MAEVTGIAYVHHTYNEWWGCSAPAGAGCDHCFATAMDRRTGGSHFGIGTRPRLTGEKNRNLPFRYNRLAQEAGERRRVLCGSMMDWCDLRAPEGARDALWQKIRETPWLDWLLLTKRGSLIERFLPEDWGDGYLNVWLGVTVENRKSGLRRMEQLRRIPAKLRFLSIEPLLEDLGEVDFTGFAWIIIGGESGQNPRRMDPAWAESLVSQAHAQGLAVFYKQNGGRGRDAGGCLLNGIEIKELPLAA
ncbi:MAG: DUF5131 family protein [Armatimonadetes bacterium]|nr:DUF5131 family protein [Armatimonadota bacterium]